jgi:hypothetical protein
MRVARAREHLLLSAIGCNELNGEVTQVGVVD